MTEASMDTPMLLRLQVWVWVWVWVCMCKCVCVQVLLIVSLLPHHEADHFDHHHKRLPTTFSVQTFVGLSCPCHSRAHRSSCLVRCVSPLVCLRAGCE